MLQAPESADVATLSLAPKNPLPYRQQLRAVRSFIDGFQQLLDAGGPVTRLVLRPKWLFPIMDGVDRLAAGRIEPPVQRTGGRPPGLGGLALTGYS